MCVCVCACALGVEGSFTLPCPLLSAGPQPQLLVAEKMNGVMCKLCVKVATHDEL